MASGIEGNQQFLRDPLKESQPTDPSPQRTVFGCIEGPLSLIASYFGEPLTFRMIIPIVIEESV